MHNPIRIGVVGAGKMGSNHLRVVSEMKDKFELVGLFDTDPSKENVAERYGIKFYPDYLSLLQDVDTISLACPTSKHKEMALLAAKQGVNALVEKPISVNYEDSVDIINAFGEKNLVLTVGQIERFNPVILTISDIIKDFNVIAVEIHRCSPYDERIFDVDVISDLMIHDIDIVLNSLGMGSVGSVNSIGKNVYKGKYVDYAQASIKFENGSLAFITSSRCTEDKIRKIIIHAEKALIEGDMFRRTLEITRSACYNEHNNILHAKYVQTSTTEKIALPNVEPLKEEFLDFYESVIGNKEPIVTGNQVIKDMKVLDEVRRIIYNGGAS